MSHEEWGGRSPRAVFGLAHAKVQATASRCPDVPARCLRALGVIIRNAFRLDCVPANAVGPLAPPLSDSLPGSSGHGISEPK